MTAWDAAAIERLTGQLDVVRAERDENRTRLDEMLRLNAEQWALYETALADRDAARADLEALRASLKPGLSPMTAARVEADLVAYKAEEALIDAAIALRPAGLEQLVDAVTSAKAAAEKIGGGS